MWVNPIVDLLIPQRATLFGWCVLFAALGMLLYYPARPLNRLIARSKEKSGIM